jgi:hypothetical protein
MHAYQIAPIDFRWNHLKTVAATASELGASEAELEATSGGVNGADDPSLREFLDDWATAKAMAGSIGWDGDLRNDPVVFWVPVEDSFRYGFVFKQDSHGGTFVVSPVPMPWYEDA